MGMFVCVFFTCVLLVRRVQGWERRQGQRRERRIERRRRGRGRGEREGL